MAWITFTTHTATAALLSLGLVASCDLAEPADGPFLQLEAPARFDSDDLGVPLRVHAAAAHDSAVKVSTTGERMRWADGEESVERCLALSGGRVLDVPFMVRIRGTHAVVSAVLYDGTAAGAGACKPDTPFVRAVEAELTRREGDPDAGDADADADAGAADAGADAGAGDAGGNP
jgi:hypothetical protein